jgi:hypothetical protein
MDLPEHIHHFSWNSHISLELPIGFEEASDDPDTNTAIYGDDLDDDDLPGGRVMAKATGVPVGDDDAFRRLADESADIEGRRMEWREEVVISHSVGLKQLLTYTQEDIDLDLVRLEAFVQAGNIVFSIVCLTPGNLGETYLPAFHHAIDTARFVLL